MGTWHAPPRRRPHGRCPVQPSTPLGPDQVNVLYYILYVFTLFGGPSNEGTAVQPATLSLILPPNRPTVPAPIKKLSMAKSCHAQIYRLLEVQPEISRQHKPSSLSSAYPVLKTATDIWLPPKQNSRTYATVQRSPEDGKLLLQSMRISLSPRPTSNFAPSS
jgi:hypothetical protein